MNRRQSIIVGVGLVITLALFVFPPWVFEYHPLDAGNGEYYNIQFSYIFLPPGDQHTGEIAWFILLPLLTTVSAATWFAVYKCRDNS